MRHGRRGRKLGRTASHRKAMLNNMVTSLFAHGSLRTTCPKAKELRSVAERLVSFAKRGDLHARRQVLKRIRNKAVVSKLFDEIGPAFAERQGGYTRILKLGARRGDSSEVCLMELVGDEFRSDYAERSSSRTAASASLAAPEPDSVGEETVPDEVGVSGDRPAVPRQDEASGAIEDNEDDKKEGS